MFGSREVAGDTRTLRDSQIILLGVCIAAATVAASIILAQASLRVSQRTKEVITVTGAAHQLITSDGVSWRDCRRRDPNLVKASEQLAAHFGVLKNPCSKTARWNRN
jgi:hypothetical protein